MKKANHGKLRKFWRILGPGLITGASDDDPSGIATYSQAGAAFSLSFLWTAIATYPLMSSIQEMCARIGLVTSHGLSGVLKRHYPAPVLWLMVIFSLPAIILNIGSDIAGMGAVANIVMPFVPAEVFSIGFTLTILFLIIRLPYRRIAIILKWLCFVLFCYLVVPFLARPDAGAVLYHTFVPEFRLDTDFMLSLVGILGTTISPYLFFWQAAMEKEEVEQRKIVVDKLVIHDMQVDVRFGIGFSNLVFYFIILATGTVLYNAGIHQIETVEDAAAALKPLAGNLSYLLFAIGVIGTGFLAIPVLAGSLSYMIAEAFGWKEGLNKKFHQAKGFYGVMIASLVVASVINFTDINPVKSLLWTAVLYGITAPVLIAIILHISNNRSVMGENVNGLYTNITGGIALLVMTVSAIILLFSILG